MKNTFVLLFFQLLAITVSGQLRLEKEIDSLEKRYQRHISIENLEDLVDAYLLNSQYVKAHKVVSHFKQHEKNTTYLPSVYLLLGKIYKHESKNDEALYHLLKSNDGFLAQKRYDKYILSGVELVEFHRRIGKYKEGTELYEKFAALARKYHVVSDTIWNGLYNRYAAILNETAKNNESIVYSKKALAIAQRMKDFDRMAISYNEMGFSYKNLSDVKKSEYNYLLAEKYWMEMGYLMNAVNTRINRLEMLSHNSLLSPQQEVAHGKELLQFIEEHGIDYPKFRIFSMIRMGYLRKREFDSTVTYINKFYESIIDENAKRMNADISNIQEKYQNEKLTLQNKQIQAETTRDKEKLHNTRLQLLGIIVFTMLFLILSIALYVLWYKLKQTNKKLIIRNQQKTVLVQEIHHRVKNNLQFVRSLLKMQQNLKEVSASDSIDDITRRIDAMSLVHEMLYIDEESMGVSTNHYIRRLLDVSTSFFNNAKKINIEVNIEDFEFPLEKLIPLGIICSELLTNSVKHAFADHDNPIFKVSLVRNDRQQYELTISDNGKEIQETLEDNRTKLGLRLIDIFSRQLNCKMEIQRGTNYQFRLIFS